MAISQNPLTPRASADMRQAKLPIIGDRKKDSVAFIIFYKIKHMLHM